MNFGMNGSFFIPSYFPYLVAKPNLKQKKRQEAIVSAHIDSLSAQVDEKRYSQPLLAQRYMDLLRRLSRKFKRPLPRQTKKSYCKHCKTVFAPGKNCRVRVHRKKIIYTCFVCKKQTRTPYSKKSKKID